MTVLIDDDQLATRLAEEEHALSFRDERIDDGDWLVVAIAFDNDELIEIMRMRSRLAIGDNLDLFKSFLIAGLHALHTKGCKGGH